MCENDNNGPKFGGKMRKYIFSHPWVLMLAIITGGMTQAAIILMSVLTMNIIDSIATGNRELFFSYIGIIAAAIIFLVLGLLICTRMFMAYMFKTGRTIKRDFFACIFGMRISDFMQENSATYISVLNKDIDAIQEKYFSTIPQFSKDSISVVLAIGAMAWISPINAVIAFFTAFLPLLSPILFAKKLSRNQLAVSAHAAYVNQKAKDYLTGFEVIKTFGVEKNILQRFNDAVNKFMRVGYNAGATVADSAALTVTIAQLILFTNYFVAGFFVLQGSISIGAVVAIVALSSDILGPSMMVANHIGSINSTKEISEKLLGIMNQKDTKTRDIAMDKFNESIKFNDVSFSYRTSNGKNETPALQNISFELLKNKKYAVVGQSGSGKSTLIKSIMGYFDDFEGCLTIDGKDIKEIDRNDLYRYISMLHQDVFILDDTLKNNIMLYNEYTDEEFNNALEKSNLISVINNLENGVDSVLGESGNILSGGEKQRIAIARAILKGSDIMILDEATAGLDNITASEIETAILDMKNVTCIYVTHRYNENTLKKCDGILVMRNGKLYEYGTFDELYEKKDYFYSLYNTVS